METKMISKTAQVTLLFWMMKIIATTLGETLGDFLAMTLKLGYGVGIMITLSFFIIVLIVQLLVKNYIPFLFWVVIVATTTLGTEISDFIDRSLGLGYTGGTAILLFGLLLTLFVWHKTHKTIKIFPITLRNQELYFWLAILFSNSLGTAFGDFLTDVLGLSYGVGALVTAAIIALVVLVHYQTKINEVVLFWIAFIFTRPFGATFGDFLTKPIEKGGLNLGTLFATTVSIGLMVVLILIEHKRRTLNTVKNAL